MPTRKTVPADEELALQTLRRRRFRRELTGMALGLSAALILSALIPAIREQYSLGIVVLWGGAIGGLLASYERFEQAGAALTRSTNTALNLLVGLGIPLLLIAALYLLAR